MANDICCDNCPADEGRIELRNVYLLNSLDNELTQVVTGLEDPVYTFDPPKQAVEIMNAHHVPNSHHDIIYMCARQRFLGICIKEVDSP